MKRLTLLRNRPASNDRAAAAVMACDGGPAIDRRHVGTALQVNDEVWRQLPLGCGVN